MNINWKKVAKTPGYKSLKAVYVDDVQAAQKSRRRGHWPMRDRNEYRKYFKEAIGFAMKYSNKWDVPIEEVLNHWESKRDYSWLNFYQEHYLSRLKPSL